MASSVDVAVTVDPSRMTDVGDANSDRACADEEMAAPAAIGAATLGAASFDDEAWKGGEEMLDAIITRLNYHL